MINSRNTRLVETEYNGHSYVDGILCQKVVQLADLVPALNANWVTLVATTVNLFKMKPGDRIVGAELVIETVVAAETISIGSDVKVDGTTADVDAFLVASSTATAAKFNSDTLAVSGADLDDGIFKVQGHGWVTATASAAAVDAYDAITGTISITYIRGAGT
jgi:hypothetical protein